MIPALLTAQEQHAGMRADTFLANALPFSRSRIADLMEKGFICVNGSPAKPGLRLRLGDICSVVVPEAAPVALIAEDIPLEIIYQDADVAVINKAKGMVVHPAPGHSRGTLVNALMYQLSDLSGINGELRPGIVHRLDKDTSGLLVVAKNDAAHICLSDQLRQRIMGRTYWALVHGAPKEDAGTVEAALARQPKDRQRMAVISTGRTARTDWTVLQRLGDAALVACKLHSGRTHQVRVHMAYIGHPVIGDPVYGPKRDRGNAKGQLLHAHTLSFMHPTTKEQMTFSAEPPEDFMQRLRLMRQMSGE